MSSRRPQDVLDNEKLLHLRRVEDVFKTCLKDVLKTSRGLTHVCCEGKNGEKIIESFYEKELFLSILQMSYYPESDSHIKEKVKVVLDLSNYATKEELGHATGVDTYDLAAKNDFIALKAEVD